MFCGASVSQLESIEIPEEVEQPLNYVPFAVDTEQATTQFRKFARSSFWYPKAIRRARLDLQLLLLPAWCFSGLLEMHWTGLTPASTSSGSRPVSGSETLRWSDVLIPASSSLRLNELRRLGIFERGQMQPWDFNTADIPYELSEMTRSAAQAKGRVEMEQRHTHHLNNEHRLTRVRTASHITELESDLVLVPIYIGVYRHNNHPYRILVNGQSGKLIGTAPTDWIKILVIIGLIVLLVLGVLTSVGVVTFVGGLASQL